jgi:hypothetical protein
VATIIKGNQDGDSTSHMTIVTSGASASRMELGDLHDRAIMNARIIDLPPGVDLNPLASDLSRMLASEQATPSLQRGEAADLLTAEAAAKKGDRSAVTRFLSDAGKNILTLAEKIGADVAVAAIKDSMGLK